MDKSSYEEDLSHPLQTNNKQFEAGSSFLTECNGIFNFIKEIIILFSYQFLMVLISM